MSSLSPRHIFSALIVSAVLAAPALQQANAAGSDTPSPPASETKSAPKDSKKGDKKSKSGKDKDKDDEEDDG